MWDVCANSETNNFNKKLPFGGIDGFRYQDPQSSPTMNRGLSPREANEKDHQRNYEPNKGIDARQNVYAGSSTGICRDNVICQD
jgi:hypothetical protein